MTPSHNENVYKSLFRFGPVWNELIIMESTRLLDYKFITLAHCHFGRSRSTNSLIPVSKRDLELRNRF